MSMHSRIVATGSYLPEQKMANAEFSKWVETSDEWIYSRTGIRYRHIAANHETTIVLAAKAAEKALENAKLSAKEIDLVIVATCTPDFSFPNTASQVAFHLGMQNYAAFDISVACTGFCYALGVADSMIKTQMAQRVLVIGAEVMSRMLDWSDRRTCVLFGDGAGAVILEKSNAPGILSSKLKADGQYGDILYTPNLQYIRGEKAHTPYLQMNGQEVYKRALAKTAEIIQETLAEFPEDQRKIDWLIPHQANIRIIRPMAELLQLPMERVILSLEEQGNTSAASIPLALDDAVSKHKIQRGDKLLLVGFGSGFTWASNLICY